MINSIFVFAAVFGGQALLGHRMGLRGSDRATGGAKREGEMMSDYPIQLRVVESFPENQEAGMMWRYESGDIPERECWWIVLPHDDPKIASPGHPSRISWRTTDQSSDPPHEMWDVSGTPPNLTVMPSIDVMAFKTENGELVRDGSYWHGFITNGALINAG